MAEKRLVSLCLEGRDKPGLARLLSAFEDMPDGADRDKVIVAEIKKLDFVIKDLMTVLSEKLIRDAEENQMPEAYLAMLQRLVAFVGELIALRSDILEAAAWPAEDCGGRQR